MGTDPDCKLFRRLERSLYNYLDTSFGHDCICFGDFDLCNNGRSESQTSVYETMPHKVIFAIVYVTALSEVIDDCFQVSCVGTRSDYKHTVSCVRVMVFCRV